MLTRENRRRMRIGRRPLQRRKKLTRRKWRGAPGIGASTTWRGAITRKQTANLAKSAWRSRTTASTKSQPRLPWQPSSSLHGRYGMQHGWWLTGQTCMETMDNVLVSFHGRGKLKQGTSSPDLPHAPIFPNNPVLAPHQVGGSLPWPDAPMGVEPRVPDSLSLPQKAPQKEESKTTKQEWGSSMQEKFPHANLPPTSVPHHL